jgi:hypothetical protein
MREKRDKKTCLKYLVVAFGLTCGLYFTLLMYYVFLTAWFSGTNSVTIHINRSGEALFEFFFIPTAIIFILAAYWFIYKKIVLLFLYLYFLLFFGSWREASPSGPQDI